jgi:hypothetical protein
LVGGVWVIVVAYAVVLHEQLAAKPWLAISVPRETSEALGVQLDPLVSIARNATDAFYGIASHLNDPTRILWREKTAYLGEVTGTFVNHNTAAVYFGQSFVGSFFATASAATCRAVRLPGESFQTRF